eukprot:364965-Chlamydomonas_euryale.AAC.24
MRRNLPATGREGQPHRSAVRCDDSPEPLPGCACLSPGRKAWYLEFPPLTHTRSRTQGHENLRVAAAFVGAMGCVAAPPDN